MITKTLDAAPGSTGLLFKAALGALPGLSRRGERLPDTELVLPDVTVDAEHLAAYSRVCGFGVRDELPVTYPHGLAFPLAMSLMTDSAFPFPMIGLVHVNNAITQRRPLHLGEPFTLRVRTADLRPHERGTQFDLIHEATVDDEPIWRDVSTYLRRHGGAGRSGSDRAAPETATELASGALWRVSEDIGRRYAAVSGDRNPIHLHALVARAFGFPRAIAHGMWTKAHAVASLEGRLPTAYTVDVAFKLPVLLPAKLAFSATPDGPTWNLRLADARTGKPHLRGTITPA